MRKAMQDSVRNTIIENENTALLLVDIGAYPFRDLLENYPDRCKNIGIFEDGMISIAAGLSLSGITPIVYGITPFIVERALEQIKLDFCYQKTGGNFITTGASYDFKNLGYSHFCPEDVAVLSQLPEIEIVTPGSPAEFTRLWNRCVFDGKPTYFRLTDHPNTTSVDVDFGKASVLKRGHSGTVITCAEMLDKTLAKYDGSDVSIIYYTTLKPFDTEHLTGMLDGPIYLESPFYLPQFDLIKNNK